jgi:hypothetical protein
MSKFYEHESKGIYYRPQLSWAETFRYAVDLSGNHTNSLAGLKIIKVSGKQYAL